jgi:V/A-type H+/Na+-transporting ATPase subunit I
MIAPMYKYAFLVHKQDYGHFLSMLRKLGVVHISGKAGDASERTLSAARELKRVQHILRKMESETPQTNEPGHLSDFNDSMEILRRAEQLFEEKEALDTSRQNIDNEIKNAEPWGNFNPETVRNLEEAGIRLHFYHCHENQFDPEWLTTFRAEIISQSGPDMYFVIFETAGERSDIGADSLPFPSRSLSTLYAERDELARQDETYRQKLYECSVFIPELRGLEQQLQSTLQISEAYDHSASTLDDHVYYLEGFVPRDAVPALMDICNDPGVIYADRRVKPDDEPPVQLKNNRFSALYESIAGLYSLPAYGELDLTPFFAPFFMLFFGFCLGDAGYGLTVLIASFIFKKRVRADLQPALRLAQWLGLATILFGIITGTFFGINLLENTPSWAQPLRTVMIDSNQAFNLALMLGFVQILFGLVLQTINRSMQYGKKYAVTPVAWIILLLSIADLAILKLTAGASVYGIYLAVILILFFNDPDSGVLVRIGKGLWQLYGITGFVGDLLSYIRLFALGISSAILGLVINDIALRMLHGVPVVGWLLFGFFLIIGHSANLLIASLGAFVHPLRLTFVEFYKNAGFSGGGKKYEPFGGEYR